MERIQRPSEVFTSFENWRFGNKFCFLCGCDLEYFDRSDEHVIPRWIQTLYNLSNEYVVLLNESKIRYKNLLIPCCKECNCTFLEPLERKVARAVKLGAEEVRSLNPWDLFLWLLKIYYCLFYKDHLLKRVQSEPDSPSILTSENLKHLEPLHLLLQMVRLPLTFDGKFPASIFIFDIKAVPAATGHFDYKDSFGLSSIAIRLGEVGIIACLGDRGSTSEIVGSSFNYLDGAKLHPVQFNELIAQIFYKNSLQKHTHPFHTLEGNEAGGVILSLGFSNIQTQDMYENWIEDDYRKILEAYTEQPIPKAGNYSFIKGLTGEFIDIPI